MRINSTKINSTSTTSLGKRWILGLLYCISVFCCFLNFANCCKRQKNIAKSLWDILDFITFAVANISLAKRAINTFQKQKAISVDWTSRQAQFLKSIQPIKIKRNQTKHRAQRVDCKIQKQMGLQKGVPFLANAVPI